MLTAAEIVFTAGAGFTLLVTAGYSFFTFLASRGQRTHVRGSRLPTVTLLICAYNEEAVIAKKVENAALTDYPADKLRVMFVNDHSTDRTREILNEEVVRIPFPVEVLDNEHERSKPNALNFAFGRIDTEIILETDADSLLEKDAVRLLVENFADPRVGGANGEVRILAAGKGGQMETDERIYRKFYNTWRKGESNIHSISICNGPVVAFRTALARQVTLNSLADDTELLFEIIKSGHRFVYDQRAVAYECTPTTLGERVRQKIRRCKGVLQVYTRNLPLLINGGYDRRIFLPVLLQFLAVPWVVTGATVLYPFLLVNNIFWAVLLLPLIWPPVFRFAVNVWLTHVIMAAAPFYIRKKWDVVASSREALKNITINR